MAFSLPQVAAENACLATIDRLAHTEHLEGALAQLRGLVPPEVWGDALLDPAREFVARPSKNFRGRLVRLGWSLAGGEADACPSDLPGLIELIHAGSLIVDDIQDDGHRRRGKPALHRTAGGPPAPSVGNRVYFAALQAFSWLDVSESTGHRMRSEAIQALLKCHHGQAIDLSVQVHQLPRDAVHGVVSTCTQMKSGALMGLAARIGARGASDDEAVVASLGSFGEQLGAGLQMLDDLGSVVGKARRHKALEDLQTAAPTWAWAFAAETCDELTFARLQREARAVCEENADPDELLDGLRERVQHTGMARVNAWLDSAFDQLRDTVGDHPALDEVHSEIERLKRSYHG